MLIELMDGSVIEDAEITGAGNADGMTLWVRGMSRTDDGDMAPVSEWFPLTAFRVIRFDRTKRMEPAAGGPVGPDDFRIGIRHQ